MNDPTTERRTASSPPDLPEFRWGDAMGVEEARASLATAVLLENALASGELEPGSRGWKARRTELVRFHLTVPRLELDGRSFLDRIEAERLAGWVELGRGPTRRRLVAPLADRLRGPIASPFEATAGEAFFALLLDISSLAYKELLDAVCRVVVEQGWADARTGAPVDRNATSVAMHDTANLCRALGLLATGGDWRHRSYGLTDLGKTTALAALRARALGPTAFPDR